MYLFVYSSYYNNFSQCYTIKQVENSHVSVYITINKYSNKGATVLSPTNQSTRQQSRQTTRLGKDYRYGVREWQKQCLITRYARVQVFCKENVKAYELH